MNVISIVNRSTSLSIALVPSPYYQLVFDESFAFLVQAALKE